MGFSLIRWCLEEQYRAIKRYRWFRAPVRLDEEYPHAVGGTVFDVGGYSGEFAIRCARELNANVFCFEPIPSFRDTINANVRAFPTIRVRGVGISDATRTAVFRLDGLGTHETTEKEGSVAVQLVDVCEAMERDAPQGVDLMKLNVEGAEFDILPRLFHSGMIKRVRSLRVQFHGHVERGKEKYEAIAAELANTHRMDWRYPFFWENWSLRDA